MRSARFDARTTRCGAARGSRPPRCDPGPRGRSSRRCSRRRRCSVSADEHLRHLQSEPALARGIREDAHREREHLRESLPPSRSVGTTPPRTATRSQDRSRHRRSARRRSVSLRRTTGRQAVPVAISMEISEPRSALAERSVYILRGEGWRGRSASRIRPSMVPAVPQRTHRVAAPGRSGRKIPVT